MAVQDIIVVGASAGGLEALRAVLTPLPPDLPASVLAVQHIGRGLNGRSILPDLLANSTRMRTRHAAQGDLVEKGVIYVAPPDNHLLVERGRVRLSHGPRENRTRPAINPLFRSAALEYGPRVAGVILTGMLDDGIAGLAEIKRRGGVAVVQDPRTAVFPSMPNEAIRRVEVDCIVPLDEIGGVLSRMAVTDRATTTKEEAIEKKISGATCPECRGPLWEETQGRIVEYRCRVGHSYSPLSLLQEHRDTVERTLWSAVVALEEEADMADRLASKLGEKVAIDATAKRAQAATIREMLSTPFPMPERAQRGHHHR